MKASEKSLLGYLVTVFSGLGAFLIYHGFLSLYKFEYLGKRTKLRKNYTTSVFATGTIILVLSLYLYIKIFDRRLF